MVLNSKKNEILNTQYSLLTTHYYNTTYYQNRPLVIFYEIFTI